MKMIKYDYWVFYIDPKYINDLSCIIHDDNCIYAYTDSKEIADLFEEFHDMEKFRRKKIPLTKEEVSNLATDELNQYLKKRKITTKDENGKKTEIEIAVTKQEEKLIDLQVMSILNNIAYKLPKVPFPINALQDNLIKELNKFYFFEIVNNLVVQNPSDFMIYGDHIEIYPKKSKIFADELSIYVYLFHDLLKEER